MRLNKWIAGIVVLFLLLPPTIAQQKKSGAKTTKHANKKHVASVLVKPHPAYDLLEYLAKNIHYPESAKESNVYGKVSVQFWVEEQGNITGVKVVRSIGAGCDEEARRVVKSMPKWVAGTYGGKPTKMLFTLPIEFKLD